MPRISYYDENENYYEKDIDKSDVVKFLTKSLRKQIVDNCNITNITDIIKATFKTLFDEYDLDDFIEWLCEEDDGFIEFMKED